jgi:hypothetical protein
VTQHILLKEEELNCVPSAGKVIITVVWDEKGVPVVNAFLKGQQ